MHPLARVCQRQLILFSSVVPAPALPSSLLSSLPSTSSLSFPHPILFQFHPPRHLQLRLKPNTVLCYSPALQQQEELRAACGVARAENLPSPTSISRAGLLFRGRIRIRIQSNAKLLPSMAKITPKTNPIPLGDYTTVDTVLPQTRLLGKAHNVSAVAATVFCCLCRLRETHFTELTARNNCNMRKCNKLGGKLIGTHPAPL